MWLNLFGRFISWCVHDKITSKNLNLVFWFAWIACFTHFSCLFCKTSSYILFIHSFYICKVHIHSCMFKLLTGRVYKHHKELNSLTAVKHSFLSSYLSYYDIRFLLYIILLSLMRIHVVCDIIKLLTLCTHMLTPVHFQVFQSEIQRLNIIIIVHYFLVIIQL